MNCRRFQHLVYEYLDGDLSPTAKAAADQHLADCDACREALQAEQHVARSLTASFRQTTEPLQLPPAVQRRVLAALADQREAERDEWGIVFNWGRFAWPLGLTAVLSLVLAGHFFFLRAPGSQTAGQQARLAGAAVSVQFSYVVPTYTFRHEDGYVVDALIYQTNVVNERLQARVASLK